MTVADNTSRNQYTATSGQTVFAYTFEIVDKDDIVVLKNGTTLSEGTNYTVSNVGNDNGGNVTLTVGATTGDILTLYRDMPYSRTQNYTNSGDFLASEVNSDFDNLWLAGEQTNRAFSQSIRKPITDSDSISMELPEAADRASSFLTFDTNGAVSTSPLAGANAPTSITRQQFTGNGSTTVFTLAADPGSAAAVVIYIDGVYQQEDTYSISGTSLTFTEAPPVNASIEAVLYRVTDIGTTTANAVSITDSGGYYTSNNVEGALQETAQSQNIVYAPAGTGAVQTTVQTKLRESVSVKDFGAVGDGVTDDSSAIQSAIDTTNDVFFPEGTYRAVGLTVSTQGQQLFSNSGAQITKNANGDILTISSDDNRIVGIEFRGEASSPSFTGHNIVCTGRAATFVRCGSRWAYARALKSDYEVRITSSKDIWQSANGSGGAASDHWDLEIGSATTVPQYGYIDGISSTQATGGILYHNPGSCQTVGSQFGKLYIKKTGSLSGTNGGVHVGNRILGAVDVEVSSAVFSSNQFGDSANITFASGTSGCRLDISNTHGTNTVTNSGNQNNFIAREASTGSVNTIEFGDDSDFGAISIDPTGAFATFQPSGSVVLPNNTSVFGAYQSDGSTRTNIAYVSSGEDIFIGDTKAGSFTSILSGDGGVYIVPNGTTTAQFWTSWLRPQADNAVVLGGASNRWTEVFAANGTINTSDAREKTFLTIEDAERNAALEIKANLRKFKFNHAIESKGDNARIHFGASAQQVGEILISHGLNPENYAFYCYDQWEAKEEITSTDTDGNVVVLQEATPAGDRYGIRYDELLAFILAVL